MRTHCLTFCRTLRAHHEGEDRGAFPVLPDADPALRSAIEGLMQDHDVIAPMLVRLQVMAVGSAPSREVARAVDGILGHQP